MNELQVFKNETFGEIRMIEINNEPWFVAMDVCKALEVTNTSKAVSRLDEDEKSTITLSYRTDGNPTKSIVNESGIYNLIMSSRKHEAKQFKRWVTHEILPTIRKHGAYMTDRKLEEVLLNPDTLIQLAQNLKEEQIKRTMLENQAKLDAPKVLFANSVSESNTTILIGELAKIIKQNGVNIGQGRLFAWLRENGYLIKRKGSGYNSPTQKSMELELFEIKETTIVRSNGSISISKTTKVTGKGQLYFVNKFLGDAD